MTEPHPVSEPDLFDPPAPVRGRRGRDKALDLYEQYRVTLVRKLREAADEAWQMTRKPISVNDIRWVLVQEQYDGDPRILGAAFKGKEWVAVGYTTTNSALANARPIRLFAPRSAI